MMMLKITRIQKDYDTHFKKIAIIKVSALNKVEKIKLIHGKFKIYWKSLLILLMQRDLQRQKFAKAEIRPRRGMEYGTLLIIPFEATRYAVLSFQNSASCAFSKTTRVKIHGRLTEINRNDPI